MELIRRGESKAVDEEDFSQEIEEIAGYSLGNQLRAGFFGQDASVQTDVSELPLVKCLSDETAQLVKEMETLKKETAVKVKFIEAQYESRLQQEAEAFYTRINYKVKAFENHHKEKITVLRNSFQQQFANAVEVIKASYKNYSMEKSEVTSSDTGRVQDLLNELQEKDFKIMCLREQLRENEEISSEPADDPEKDWLRTENNRLKDDVNSLHIEMEQIRQALEAKDQSLKDMALNISQLQSKADGDRKALQKLSSENDKLKVQLNLEKENGRIQICQLKQKAEKVTESTENSPKKERRHEEERLAKQESQRDLLAQEDKLNTQKTQRAAAPVELDSNNKDLTEELEKLRQAERSQKQHIDRLEKKIAMTNEAWEKKFEILRQSFHAIKDEMFLRQSLQRQAASLHQASVNYAMKAPVSHQGQNPEEASFSRTCFSTKTPLPSIGAREMQTVRLKTVTIHLPSGQTDPFSASEASEGDSDEESTKILPLPPPPNRPTPSNTTFQVQSK
ncbi:uncharacterized protein C10orf67 homolog, mitochondrial [Colossoma macropomum]|uniref:uncharacterized protein C10orf67 homolog, mitochondrial n=1 Tax=Colossoma macropomum TaxID=42526 RepID=UPI001864D30F|nr:uncharacterized protein C10orf67 homolog, mitochondrial [Colossoma macropomum]